MIQPSVTASGKVVQSFRAVGLSDRQIHIVYNALLGPSYTLMTTRVSSLKTAHEISNRYLESTVYHHLGTSLSTVYRNVRR